MTRQRQEDINLQAGVEGAEEEAHKEEAIGIVESERGAVCVCVCASRKHGGHQLGERGRAKKRTNTVVGECVTEDRERAIRVSLITRRVCLLLLLRQENIREGVTDRGRRGEQFEETRDQALPLPRGINHRPSVLLWGEPAKSASRVVAAVEGQHALPHPKRHIDCAKGGRSSNFEQRKKKKERENSWAADHDWGKRSEKMG